MTRPLAEAIRLVAHHTTLPLTAQWGEGDVASADGVLGWVLLSVRLPRSAAVFRKSFVFSFLLYKEGFWFCFLRGASAPLFRWFLFCFQRVIHSRSRYYYLFFNYLS